MIWYLLHGILLALLAFWAKPKETHLYKVYAAGLAYRLAAGLVLGYSYLHVLQGGDTLVFHQQAEKLYLLSQSAPADYLDRLFTAKYPIFLSQARNDLFTRILSVLYVISGGSYWIASLYLSLVSFLASWYLVRSLRGHYPDTRVAAAWAFLFFPSPVFWSSGVLKDALINGAVFFLAGSCVRYFRDVPARWWEVVLVGLALLLLFYLKFYLAAAAFVVMGLGVWAKGIRPLLPSRPARWVAGLAFLSLLVVLASRANYNLNLEHLPRSVYTNYQMIFAHSSLQNTLTFPHLEPTWGSLLDHLPRGLVGGLLRPTLAEVTLSTLLYGLENTLILGLLLYSLLYANPRQLDTPTWLLLMYVLILATFLPLASPNFGSLTRYKAAYLPFLVYLVSVIPFGHLGRRLRN